MICSIFLSSWLCFINQPIVYEKQQEVYDKTAVATAYNLTESQTDSTPCVGAWNNNLCEILREEPGKCIVATRLYDNHTILCIEGFGRCEVLDKTSKKYGDRIDLLLPTYEEAINFGKRQINYRVIKGLTSRL